ncbi:hypothetical protein C8R46DRAFT_1099739 [Mycena filopes]|nr:hypothetical protein C8R46DRAFT_1099739 [Mycena filopes]
MSSAGVYTANASSRPILSTVAPPGLREILTKTENEDDPTKLACATIEYQLECHNNYISAPRKSTFPVGVPSLVNALAAKIPETEDGVDSIPDLILSQHIWGWHTITYALLRKGLARLESASDGPPTKRQKMDAQIGETLEDIDEWIITHEKHLGDNERLGDDWHFGLVTLADSDAVFPSSTKTSASRTIVRPTTLPGYQVLQSTRAPKIEIQPSTAAFKSTFDRLSDGLLKGLDWNNVFIAGGIILGTLLAVETQPDIPAQWAASDIDVYLYGLGPEAANAKLEHLFKTFGANLPRGTPTLVVRNSKTVTFYARYPLRRIQVVLKLVKSPRAILLNFDLDVCAMGWDGSELWMLPRAARALETGFSVFTMNLIQGHYLSERRATQEQRVFKYANRGYGIRILPSYLTSLSRSKTNLADISREEVLFELDMDKIAQASRAWTRAVVNASYRRNAKDDKRVFSHRDLENGHQVSAEPQGRSCLTGFSLFMRHVALWDLEQSGELLIDAKEWVSTDYGNESVLAYDDTPNYTWGPEFTLVDFAHKIDVFNLRQVTDWLDDRYSFLKEHSILEDYDNEFEAAKRLSYAPTAAGVLKRGAEIVLPVLLPDHFAVFANRLVGEAQAAAGLKVTRILTPAMKAQNYLVDKPSGVEGIFLWRIGQDIMWQQLDRRIDEVFEALYAFYRINDRTYGEYKETRLLTQLSKRAVRPVIEDEFDAFARWVGRRPVFLERFYNSWVRLDEIDGQFWDEAEK